MLPPDNITQPFERNLFRALHCMCGATQRWAERRSVGVSDSELTAALKYEFGIFTGCSSRECAWNVSGEGQPKFWLGHDYHGVKPTLEGPALLAATRELLDIPLPVGEPTQLNLF